jgi:hypothetical protein
VRGGSSEPSSMFAGMSSEEAMLFGASDGGPPSASTVGAERDRRHWRVRGVPSMSLPFSSSICLATMVPSRTITQPERNCTEIWSTDIFLSDGWSMR